ncbi:MAG: hypothetical protein PVI57_01315 [Gemmatimonadota bacterium]|jgi:hypothetical protein
MRPPPTLHAVLAVTILPLLTGCGPRTWDPTVHELAAGPPDPSEEVPYLKAHLASGHLVLFSTWEATEDGGRLVGDGVRYDARRRFVGEGRLTLTADSIALLESNRPERVSQLAHGTLIVWTALSAAVTGICVADPKACFGSCPTFYLEGGDGQTPVAEGFSSSFARALEATDLDALGTVSTSGRSVALVMRNEAQETHAVRTVRLLAVPLEDGGSVSATAAGTLYRTGPPSPAVSCRAAGGSCLERVLSPDGAEYFSLADSADLGAKEEVEIVLDPPEGAGELALAIRARSSLLSTFLFYHTIATLGSRAGDWLAELERGRPAAVQRSLGLARALGGVEVRVEERDGSWRLAGTFGEAGPIASDEQLVPLGLAAGPVRIRLRMTRGNWRIDHTALVRLAEPVLPLVLEPSRVVAVDPATGGLRPSVGESDASVRAALVDPDRYLVTQRGDAHRIEFELPGAARGYALFLESRGYYYEWMRREWRGQEDPALARLILLDPSEALRRLAPVYKAREGGMEDAFWSSRFRGGVR